MFWNIGVILYLPVPVVVEIWVLFLFPFFHSFIIKVEWNLSLMYTNCNESKNNIKKMYNLRKKISKWSHYIHIFKFPAYDFTEFCILNKCMHSIDKLYIDITRIWSQQENIQSVFVFDPKNNYLFLIKWICQLNGNITCWKKYNLYQASIQAFIADNNPQ